MIGDLPFCVGRKLIERDFERLQSLLFVTERRLDAFRQEVDVFWATVDSSLLRFDNQARVVESQK